jgi:hypothetical protein
MRHSRNERGAALLLYVMMLSLVLAIAGPYLLRMMNSSELSETGYRNQKLADNLAVSAMDALLKYLGDYQEDEDQSREDYLKNYPGYRTLADFQTPEGTAVSYSMNLTEALGEYTVTVTVKAGNGPARRNKTIEFTFHPSDGQSGPSGTRIVTNDNERVTVLPGGNGFYVEGNFKENDHNLNKKPSKQSELQAAIATAIETYKDKAHALYHSYNAKHSEAQIISCNPNASNGQCLDQSDWNQLAASIQESKAIRLPAGGFHPFSVTFGSEDKPVYVFFDSVPDLWGNNPPNIEVFGAVIFRNGTNTRGINLTVHGDVLVNGNYSPYSSHTINIHKRNGSGGNFYVLGDFTPANNLALYVEGNFYADKVKFNVSSNINVRGKLIVENELEFSNSMSRFETGQDLLIGSYKSCCHNHLVSGGDILVQGDIERSRNSLSMTAGGHIAVGGSVSFTSGWEHPITVNFGSGSTSLIIEAPEEEDPDEPGPTPSPPAGGGGGSWNPVRQT